MSPQRMKERPPKKAKSPKQRRFRPSVQHIRHLRRSLGVTQQKLAEMSESLPAPISREFVANLETRGLPGTVKKFLSFALLTHADLRLLNSLATADRAIKGPIPPYEKLLEKVENLVHSGRPTEALNLCLAGIRQAEAEERVIEQSRLLLTSAILCLEAGSYLLARDYAEEALTTERLSPGESARVYVVIGSALAGLGRFEMAKHHLAQVDRSLFDDDPELAVHFHVAAGRWAWLSLDWQACRRHADEGLDFAGRVSMPQEDLRLRGYRVMVEVEAGDLDRAESAYDEVADIPGIHPASRIAGYLLQIGARLALVQGDLPRAQDYVARISSDSEAMQDPQTGFSVGLLECECALLSGDQERAHDIAMRLRAARDRVCVTAFCRREYSRIIEQNGLI